MSIKQVIVMRTDLNMRKGKMVVQGAHATLMVNGLWLQMTPEQRLIYQEWLTSNGMKKICVGVSSLEELDDVCFEAGEAGILYARVRDAGLTEFSEPTITCAAIGPGPSEEIDKITGHLKLL